MSAGPWLWACAGPLLLLACDPEPQTPVAEQPAADQAHEATELPGLSLYQLEGEWTDAQGHAFRIESLRGHPVLVMLFYGNCQRACPTLVRDLVRLEASLAPSLRERTRFLLVTLDPEHDTLERLVSYAREHQLDPQRWTLLRGAPEQVRELAVALGIRYRAAADGSLRHTLRVTLLDAQGVTRGQLDGLGQPIETLGSTIAELAEAAGG